MTTADPNIINIRKDKVGIGFGAFGYNLGAAGLMTYLTFFYTDYMLIPAASVALILLLSRVIDAFTDIFMGSLVDRCKSKMGKARPWILWMALPAVISVAAVYYVPESLSIGARTVYAFITYNLMAFFYLTALYLPLTSLVALIVNDGVNRLKLSQIFGFFTTLGAVFVNFFSQDIMKMLSGGAVDANGNLIITANAYFLYFTIFAVVGVGLMVVCVFLTKERALAGCDIETGEEIGKVPFKKALPAVLKNKYWWNAMGIFFMTALVPACWAVTAYYCIYFLGGAVNVGVLMSMLWGGITAGILLFMPISRKFGKSTSAAIGLVMQAIGSVMLWVAPTSIPMLWISTVFRSVGVGGLSGGMTAMLADVVEYGEWKTGVRAEGLTYSGSSFGNKVGQGVGSAVVAAMLAWGQYVPGVLEQSDKALQAIKITFIAIPFIGDVLIIIMLLLFRVEKLMPQIQADLAARRAKAGNTTVKPEEE